MKKLEQKKKDLKTFHGITKFVNRKLEENKTNTENIMKFVAKSINNEYEELVEEDPKLKYEKFFDYVYGK